MPRPSNSNERRSQIVWALMRTMARKGYAGASVASIAREAGLSPGLVHYHFDSKQEVLLALMDVIHNGVLARFEERLALAGEDPWRRLFALTDALLAHDPSGGTAPLEVSWIVIASEAVHQPAVRAEYARMLSTLVERIEELLRELLRAEARSTRNARSLSAAIAAAIQGVYQMDSALPGAAKTGSSAPALRHMVEGIVAAQPRRARRRASARERAGRGA